MYHPAGIDLYIYIYLYMYVYVLSIIHYIYYKVLQSEEQVNWRCSLFAYTKANFALIVLTLFNL